MPDADEQEPGQQVAERRCRPTETCVKYSEAGGQQRHPDDEHRLDADPRHELRRDRRPDDRRPGDREVRDARSSSRE